jgi:amino acid permease
VLSIVSNIYVFCVLCTTLSGIADGEESEAVQQHHRAAASANETGSRTPLTQVISFCVVGRWAPPTNGSIAYLSLIMNAVIIQMNALPMYQQLQDRTPGKFTRILSVAFVALFILFGSFASVAYCAFGGDVSSNVLNSLNEDVWGSAARIAIAVVVAGVYPLLAMAMTAPLLAVYPKNSPQMVFGTLVIVSVSCLASLWLSDLGLVNVIAGASQLFYFVGLAPAFVGIYLVSDDGGFKDSSWWRFGMGLLVTVTTAGSVLCFMFGTNNFTDELMETCQLLGHVGGVRPRKSH